MNDQPFDIEYVSSLAQIEPGNDNVDVHVRLRDGRVYSFLIATPNNIYKCMTNEGNEYFFGVPPLFVKILDRAHVEDALIALFSEGNERWLEIYGTLQISPS